MALDYAMRLLASHSWDATAGAAGAAGAAADAGAVDAIAAEGSGSGVTEADGSSEPPLRRLLLHDMQLMRLAGAWGQMHGQLVAVAAKVRRVPRP